MFRTTFKSIILKYYQIIFFLFYLLIAHFILPNLLNKSDFSIFYTWNLFSSGPKKVIYDLSVDGGESFLFRDHRDRLKAAGIDLIVFYKLNRRREYEKITKNYKSIIKKIYGDSSLTAYKIKGSMHNHFIEKKDPIILKRMKVYD